MRKDEKQDVIRAWHHIGGIEETLDGLPPDQLAERRGSLLHRARMARWLLGKHFSRAEYEQRVAK